MGTLVEAVAVILALIVGIGTLACALYLAGGLAWSLYRWATGRPVSGSPPR